MNSRTYLLSRRFYVHLGHKKFGPGPRCERLGYGKGCEINAEIPKSAMLGALEALEAESKKKGKK
jgi:hypothetical protein